LELQITALVPDHPVIADPPLGLQPENLAQVPDRRLAPVIVLRLSRWLGKTTIMFHQILLLQIMVGRLVAGGRLRAQAILTEKAETGPPETKIFAEDFALLDKGI
jgi:hypothetical protein